MIQSYPQAPMGEADMGEIKKCPGYGLTLGKCENPAGSQWSPNWCHGCDSARVYAISAKLEEMDRKLSTQEKSDANIAQGK